MADILDAAQTNNQQGQSASATSLGGPTQTDPSIPVPPPQPAEPPAEPVPEPTSAAPISSIPPPPPVSDNLVVPPPGEIKQPEPTSKPKKKKVSPAILITGILLVLITLPLIVIYSSQQRQVAEIRSGATAPTCINIVVVKNGKTLTSAQLAALNPGATISLRFKPVTATKVRFKINNGSWHETATKSNGYFILSYTLANTTQFNIVAQWFNGTSWQTTKPSCTLTFIIVGPTPTPTPTPTGEATPTPTPTGEATPTPTPTSEATPTPTPTDEATPTPTPTDEATPTPTPTPGQQIVYVNPTQPPAASCNSTCTVNTDCPITGFVCLNGVCRNASCADSTTCSCGALAQAPQPTPKTPVSGGPTVLGVSVIGIGTLILILGLAL